MCYDLVPRGRVPTRIIHFNEPPLDIDTTSLVFVLHNYLVIGDTAFVCNWRKEIIDSVGVKAIFV